ncbi:TIGR02680 family protein [Ornithinibacillus halotolerans]|uniref:TIGR02680 family protein n=1 Tax=Ornithinibacillus halotolerans TaxID=1274357 RepID=A0A916W5B7_9BACI|nr:TIGR02680 family protein [Ornithinibacillus halotolerans]GGA66841.1 TIGR02680 family protein [Ornithinibacillus halotolerans]
MKKYNKWKMNRAGLLNFWYYDDEIFEFSDGKLLLRGSNGSGKSVTMQSILPVLLDGKKSPDRLDPFGSKARKMEDYLLGEKDIVNRDERTGYLFIEYKREDTNQYITTGMGLQARRNKTLNAWYFVITDNRRIGKDFALFEVERNAGEKQQIPLSRIQLENRIGSGGYVVRTQTEYMKLVNKYIFGFEEIEAYEDLIKLLIQLRSPKLSKDFKPTVIYEILEAALPPLTDVDLRHLSDTIEHMDQTKQQVEQLEREQEALVKLINRYDAYNEYRMADTAQELIQVKRKHTKEIAILDEKKQEEATLAKEIQALVNRNLELGQAISVLEQKQARLHGHKVWNLEKELTDEQHSLDELKKDAQKKDEQLTDKKRQELDTKERRKKIEGEIVADEERIADILMDMQNDAAESSFERHELNVQDFYRNKINDFDFTVWSKEAENHAKVLDKISEELRTYENLKERLVEFQKNIADQQLELDQIKQEEKDWGGIFERDKQEKLNEIHAWIDEYPFFQIDEALLHQVSRSMDQLFEPYSYEVVRAPFIQVNNEYKMSIHEKIATKNSKLTELKSKMVQKEIELSTWKQKRDPEPPNQQEATREARKLLLQNGQPFVAFYEAVEFQEHVTEEVRKRIEAALLDSGVLDALITDPYTQINHDRVIIPQPNMMAHTLADYLIPDLAEDSTISPVLVDEVLRSILVDEGDTGSGFSIHEDGTYQIGLLHGHAVEVESVRFIGRNARKRYREEQIATITAEIDELKLEMELANQEIAGFQAAIQAADDATKRFPTDEDLQVGFQQIKEKRFQMEQLRKELQRLDSQAQETSKKFQDVKRSLDNQTRGLNIAFSYEAYAEAKVVMRSYEKALGEIITLHTSYLLRKGSLLQAENRLEELIEEVDELQGELNLLHDKVSLKEKNINEIEKQLKLHGAEDIRKQIQEVQSSLTIATSEQSKNQQLLPRKETRLETLQNEMNQQQQKIAFLQNLSEAWSELFSQEVQYGFVTLPDELAAQEYPTWVHKTYKQLVKDRDSTQISSQLTSTFYEQQSNLMEYRMSDIQESHPEFAWMAEEWTDEQNIQINNWKQKAARRLIQLDFQGKRVSPYFVREKLEKDHLRQQHLLDDQDRKLYEEILFDSVGKKLRSRIGRAQSWTDKMDKLMTSSDSSSGLSFSIRWKPRTAETEAELDTKELVDLLRRDARLLKDEDIDKVIEHFRSKINRAKELVALKGEGNTLLQVLKEVLDYRNWFSFVLSYKREGEPKRELTNHAFFQFSGGEKAMAMYIPLFTACYSRYQEADPSAPYIISLDEAFAGVDEDNISVMFRIVEELGFDYMMNSQVLWGDYETISSLSICEIVRPKNQDFVTVIRYHWDGNKRSLLVDNEQTEVVEV